MEDLVPIFSAFAEEDSQCLNLQHFSVVVKKALSCLNGEDPTKNLFIESLVEVFFQLWTKAQQQPENESCFTIIKELSTLIPKLSSCVKTVRMRSMLLDCALFHVENLSSRDKLEEGLYFLNLTAPLATLVTEDAMENEESAEISVKYYLLGLCVTSTMREELGAFQTFADGLFHCQEKLASRPFTHLRIHVAQQLEKRSEHLCIVGEYEKALCLLKYTYAMYLSSDLSEWDGVSKGGESHDVNSSIRSLLTMFVWSLPHISNGLKDAHSCLKELEALEPQSALVVFLQHHLAVRSHDSDQAHRCLVDLVQHPESTAEMCCAAFEASYNEYDYEEVLSAMLERFADDSDVVIEIAKVALNAPQFAEQALLKCLNDDRLKESMKHEQNGASEACILLWNAACILAQKEDHERALGMFLTVFDLHPFSKNCLEEDAVVEAILYSLQSCQDFERTRDIMARIRESIRSKNGTLLSYKIYLNMNYFDAAKNVLETFSEDQHALRWAFAVCSERMFVGPALDVIDALLSAEKSFEIESPVDEFIMYLNMTKLVSSVIRKKYDCPLLSRLLKMLSQVYRRLKLKGIQECLSDPEKEISWIASICISLAAQAFNNNSLLESGSLFRTGAELLLLLPRYDDSLGVSLMTAAENALSIAIEVISRQNNSMSTEDFNGYRETFKSVFGRTTPLENSLKLLLLADFWSAFLEDNIQEQFRILKELSERFQSAFMSHHYLLIAVSLQKEAGEGRDEMRRVALEALLASPQADSHVVSLYAFQQLLDLPQTEEAHFECLRKIEEYVSILPEEAIQSDSVGSTFVWWMVSTAWNRGVSRKQLGKMQAAETFFQFSISIINKLEDHCSKYKAQMQAVLDNMKIAT